MTISVRQATIDDLPGLVPLFDGYRQFYGRASEPELARQFLHERFRHLQSIILIAEEGEAALGFTQLYPSFSSVRCARTFILNDLFVTPEARGRGVAGLLLDGAAELGKAMGAAALSLSTALDNRAAQAAYHAKGWKRDEAFCTYHLLLA